MPPTVHSRIHSFIHSFNKGMLITYYTFKHHTLGTTHLRLSQSINLVYIASFYIAFIFPHLQNHNFFFFLERERKHACANGEVGERILSRLQAQHAA